MQLRTTKEDEINRLQIPVNSNDSDLWQIFPRQVFTTVAY